MNKKSKYLFYTFLTLLFLLVTEGVYLNSTKVISGESLAKKVAFVKISQLPDLAISTEATFVRHRSLGTVFSIYKDDGDLREYFPSTYAISHSHIINKKAIKIDNEK